MTAAPRRWRRLAIKLARHASWVLPDTGPWADAMRHELDHIADDTAALLWAYGCLLASYRARLTQLRCIGARVSLRYVGTTGVLLLAVGLVLGGHASGQTEPLRPVFDETACDLPGVSPAIRPRLRCGTVSVPRRYENPGADRFRLAVVVVRSAQQPTFAEPVVYINGGPGGPLTIYADHQARTPYAPGRDLILVDQRGTGRSEPNICPDLDGAFLNAAVAVATDPSDDALARRLTVYATCRDEAAARGFDLKDFGTSVTVADFESVRRALGVERWNVYGESYGTTVAMTLVALHPETVRTAVLDSIYPPDPRPIHSANVAEALDAFFRYCAGDQACAAAYPDLAATYRETVSALAQAPLVVAVPPEMHSPDDRVSLTSTLFETLVSRFIYYPTAYPGLPHLIAAVHDRDSQGFGKVFSSALTALAAEVNRSTYVAVECRDRPHYRNPLPAGSSVLDRLLPYGLCHDWSEIGPAPLVPAGTAVPTLVLAGEFDPVTRPSLSQHVAALIGPNARWIEFPRIGHNVRAFSPCGAKIVADFIDNPAQSLDTSCADRAAPIRFVPK
jgi:pimeloyl-ACP methyl ester carboxylesterase